MVKGLQGIVIHIRARILLILFCHNIEEHYTHINQIF